MHKRSDVIYQCWRTNRNSDRHEEGKSSIFQLKNAVRDAKEIYREIAKCLTYIRAEYLISHYLMSDQISYKYHSWTGPNVLLWNQNYGIVLISLLVIYLITSPPFPSWHFQFITSCRTHSDLISKVCIK
jgi:hypothetical protein